MPFIEELLSYGTLSIVGLEKNTGKTECLNYILKRIPFDKRVGVSSIGIDGESKDQVTFGSKPEIYLREGMLFTTSEKHYRERHIVSEILNISDESTSLGRLVTALSKGRVLLSGPSTTYSLKRWIAFLKEEHSVEICIIDGALSRLSPASPVITDAMILSTGASLSLDTKEIAARTAFTVEMINLPLTEVKLKDGLKEIDKGIWIIDKFGNITGEPLGSSFKAESFQLDWNSSLNALYICGALTDRLLNSISLGKNLNGLEVIIKDFTKMFASNRTYSNFLRKGGKLSVLYKSKLIAITINPLSPNGILLDSEKIFHELKNLIDIPVFDIFKDGYKLELSSALSRHMLLESKMYTCESEIEESYSELKDVFTLFSKRGRLRTQKPKIKLKLSHLKDIRTTLSRLSEGVILDDIELFEIKQLAIINQDIKEITGNDFLNYLKLPDLNEVIDILDPESKRINSFYIYDNYSEDLKNARDHLRVSGNSSPEVMNLISSLEEAVRKNISESIGKFSESLNVSLYRLSKTDILIAKAEQMEDMKLTIPSISRNNASYKAMFNPEVSEILKQNKREFQPVEISFHANLPLLITGSNMGGKSVTLKTLALCQYLFQFGFGIPASEASIPVVDCVAYSSGDGQDYKTGLSSFAAEIKRIDHILKLSESGNRLLALIDEPAGTTNPREGTALAAGLIKVLVKKTTFSVLTTHYNLESINCNKLKVVGLVNGKMNYSLMPVVGTTVPEEALKIAETLEIDHDWLNEAKQILEKLNI